MDSDYGPDAQSEEKQVCSNCGNDTFWVFMTTGSNMPKLFCSNCGEGFPG